MRKLSNGFSRIGRNVWVDWQDIPRGENWLNEIFSGIEQADTFLIVVSRHSLISEVCNDEIRYAREKYKRIFPLIREEIKDDVFNEVAGSWFGKPWEQTARKNWTEIGQLNWVFFNDDTQFTTEFDALVEALDTDQMHVPAHTRYLVRALEWDRRGRKPSLLLIGDEITAAETWLLEAEAKAPQLTPLHQHYITESRRVQKEQQKQIRERVRRTRQFQIASFVLGILTIVSIIVIMVAVMAANNAQWQRDEAATQVALAGTSEAEVREERELFGLEQARVGTLAAGGAGVGDVRGSQTSNEFKATVTAIAALNEWQPVLLDFDRVQMVQVPAGCFYMGSIFQANEQPVHKQCFDTPFWIDRYEVTNAQFNRLGVRAENESRWTDSEYPRQRVTWNEAKAFCELRGARLPTEREWEYAARGPDNFLYPWGNEFDSDNVVYWDNSNGEVAPVGSRPEGASWVGMYGSG